LKAIKDIWLKQNKKMGLTFELEVLYKTWHILSWIFLIFGYSLLIVNSTLFPDDPQLLFGLGMFMLSISLVNFYFIIINVLLLTYLIIKEKDWYDNREYFWSSISYIIVSIILLQASLMK
jgi:hypothetical protein